MSHAAPSILVLLVLPFASAAGAMTSDPDRCAPAPRTGCFQSGDVEVQAELGHNPNRDTIDWSWEAGDAASSDELGDPRHGEGYALCLYDGAATPQSETEAPAPGTDSLVLGLDAPGGSRWFQWQESRIFINPNRKPDGLLFGVVEPGEDGRLHFGGSGKRLGLDALRGVDPERVISQVQGPDGACWGAEVSVVLRNPPPFALPGIPSDDVIDEAKARALLDELAALYNRKLGGQGPLDMTLWSNALGATEIQNQVATSDPDDLDLEAIASALYVFGWYGGTLFQRDGFQGNPGPAGPANPDPAQFEGALSLFRNGIAVSTTGSDADVFAFLEDSGGGGPGGQGTGVLSVAESFGYNTGYGYAVLEDLIDVFQPPDDKLVCSGITARTGPNPIHPKLPFVPADAPLYDCEYNPSFLDARIGLRGFLDEYLDPANPFVPTLPAHLQPDALKARQDILEGSGQFVWKVFLSGVILQDQAYRESLWDVDNAFLEVVEAAGLLGLGALARNDAEIGRRAVLASGTVLSGWLASYSFGLTAPSGPEPHDPGTDPRVLPLFDLGTTPIDGL